MEDRLKGIEPDGGEPNRRQFNYLYGRDLRTCTKYRKEWISEIMYEVDSSGLGSVGGKGGLPQHAP